MDEEHTMMLRPTCGWIGYKIGACYLSMYHDGDHEIPDRNYAVDSGRLIKWPKLPVVVRVVEEEEEVA